MHVIRKLLHVYKWRERENHNVTELWSYYCMIVWLYIVLYDSHTHGNLSINSGCCAREQDHTWMVRSYPGVTSWKWQFSQARSQNWNGSLKGVAENSVLVSLSFDHEAAKILWKKFLSNGYIFLQKLELISPIFFIKIESTCYD